MLGGLALGLPALAPGGQRRAKAAGANSDIRLAILGLGGINIVGSVGGRGRQLIAELRNMSGVRIAALCDVDQAILSHGVALVKERYGKVAAYSDLRKLLDDKSIDAVAVALPNHWHSLAALWACQAGKDVYVEKPFSQSIWEGRQVVAAARKYGRIVQTGTQSRSSPALLQAFADLKSGLLGPIRYAHAIVYRPRDGIGKVGAAMPIPPTVDYDLWCGPTAKAPLMRKDLHYHWHWFWATGNGELGNNGVHDIDVCRWALGQSGPPPRVLSIGGRFGPADDGQTANTQLVWLDYQPAPLICEIRNLYCAAGVDTIGKFHGLRSGVVIECEGGSFAGGPAGGTLTDREGRVVKKVDNGAGPGDPVAAHLANFLAAVRSRKTADLHAEAQVGHVSATCCHLGNISYRLGRQAAPEAIMEQIRANAPLADACQRCGEHLRANGVDLTATPAAVGPCLTFDPQQEQFVGEFAAAANKLARRDDRPPFVVPQLA
jgi:predicted dehydrogenase